MIDVHYHTSRNGLRAITSAARIALFCGVAFILAGCGAAKSPSGARNDARSLGSINDLRTEAGLSPLERSATLDATALARAKASSGTATSDDTPLPRIVAAGCYARFALSHSVKGKDFETALAALLADPLGRSKAQHASLSHVGMGFDEASGVLVVDFARLVPPLDTKAAESDIRNRIDAARKRNSAGALVEDAALDKLAERVAADYMAGKGSSDTLIAEAQKEIGKAGFSMGRVTIAFQIVSDTLDLTVPERLGDPALSLLGVGIAQGNLAPHEPGAVALALFVAEPQGAHEETRARSDLPAPKAAPAGGDALPSKGSLVDQAWTATLAANHERAAALFEQAFRKSKGKAPNLLYEAGRAYARAKRDDKAMEALREYAGLVTGKEKTDAEEMVAKLERKESIFDTSSTAAMSVEGKRFFLIGQRLFSQGEWDGAIDAFQQAYAYAAHPDILYNIGLAHLKSGRIGTALDFFGEYQRVVPAASNVDQARQLFEIGVELYRVGQFEAASKRFAMAFSFMPAPDLMYNLALCHKAMGDTAEALRLLREFLDANPETADKAQVEAMIDELAKGTSAPK